jgi:peptidoglycan/LPS O-acetylase OafA/YrhL
MVYVHHSLPAEYLSAMPHLWVISRAAGAGLQVFFVLSSYLITELLLRETEQTGTIHLRAFYTRRILRIWPLYFVFIIGCFVFDRLHHSSIFPLSAFVSFLLLAGNWFVARYNFFSSVVSPLWSISLEEQFYLLWPPLCRFGKVRALWTASILLYTGSYAVLYLLDPSHRIRAAIWANSFIEFQFFALGAILALLLHHRSFNPRPAARLVMLALFAVTVLVAERYFHIVSDFNSFRNLVPAYLLVSAGISALFLSCFLLPVPHWLNPLVYLGRRSYGLYVFHEAANNVGLKLTNSLPLHGVLLGSVRLLVSLSLCILFAVLSYHFLEMPFLKLKRRFAYVPTGGS